MAATWQQQAEHTAESMGGKGHEEQCGQEG